MLKADIEAALAWLEKEGSRWVLRDLTPSRSGPVARLMIDGTRIGGWLYPL